MACIGNVSFVCFFILTELCSMAWKYHNFFNRSPTEEYLCPVSGRYEKCCCEHSHTGVCVNMFSLFWEKCPRV